MQCNLCGVGGRVARVYEKNGETVAVYECPNAQCGNYRKEFDQAPLPKGDVVHVEAF